VRDALLDEYVEAVARVIHGLVVLDSDPGPRFGLCGLLGETIRKQTKRERVKEEK
jgi:hypothetical protein